MDIWPIITGMLLVGAVALLLSFKGSIFNCAPNEVIIFTGKRRRVGANVYGYRVIKGGMGWRWPLIERVDRMDLTNMVIDVQAMNAYSKGGIPLSVQGVANVKVAGHEPILNNAIERFLGKTRQEIMQIAKATLEGALRGVLASMTPEQVNEDKILFAEKLVQEVEQDLTALGLVVDTLKIQTVTDEVKYLDSIGRKKNAEIVSRARIAEALAHAQSIVRSAENLEKETKAQNVAAIATANADAERRLTEIRTRRAALVAEELATVNAAVARARAELQVQKARVEQVRRQLDADIIQPAKAAAEAAEAAAKAEVAPILEDGRARAEALKSVAASLKAAGPAGRDLLMLQKLPEIVSAVSNVIADTHVERVTIIDGGGEGESSLPMKAVSTLEQVKQLFGVDLVQKFQEWGGDASGGRSGKGPTPATTTTSAPTPEPEPPAPSSYAPVETRSKRERKVIRVEPAEEETPSFEIELPENK
ncbi:MAG TPA: flotillin family protein [Fimbriimonadaceae bacterium]|nr:flotillin family protein [Fimbriimonadaceae bacterium]